MSSKNSIPAEDVRRLLVQRILSSSYLTKSARLSEMFLYLSNRVLDDCAEDIHEQEVGRNVFGRSADYDTMADNIVRVQVSMLRKRIDQYFANEGRHEPLIIDIPKGNYAPEFRKRPPAPAPVAVPPPADAQTAPEAGIVPKPRRWIWLVPVAPAILFCCTTTFMFVRNRALERADTRVSLTQPALQRFWSQIFVPGKTTEVVLDDAAVGMYQEITGRQIQLSNYFDRSYRTSGSQMDKNDPNQVLEDLLLLRRESSFENVALLPDLIRLASSLGATADIRFARGVSFRDLKSSNLILLGNGYSNPWIQPFEKHLSVQWAYDRASDSWYPVDTAGANRKQYLASAGTHNSYATVALLPNLDGNGHVLIVSGTGGSAISAALAFLSDEHSMEQLHARLARRLASQHGAGFAGFDILLHVENRNDLSRLPAVVLCRQPQS